MSCDWQMSISSIKDVILAIAAVVTALVASIGLKKWRAELKGRTEYEVARRVIKGLYKVRDGFNSVRSPFIWPSEYSDGHSDSCGERPNNEKKSTDVHVYQNRWNYLTEAFRELDSEVLEAEVIWGQDIEKLMREIRGCRNELLFALQQYLASINRIRNDPDREQYRKLTEKITNFNDPKDEFSNRITAAINALEEKIRPHLKR